MTTRFHLFGWMFLIGLVCLTGCQTADQAHMGHMASIKISGYSKTQIQEAIAKVFKTNGYTKVDSLTFEKPGSAWDTASYGGWSSSSVWIRFRCELISTETHEFDLGCDAFVVEGHDDIGTEIERKFWFAKRDDCKSLLDQIMAELRQASADGDSVSQ